MRMEKVSFDLWPGERTPDTVVAASHPAVRDLVARFPVRGGLLNRVTREVHADGEGQF